MQDCGGGTYVPHPSRNSSELEIKNWIKKVIRKYPNYNCYALFLMFPSDKEMIRYLTEFGNDAELVSGEKCLVVTPRKWKDIVRRNNKHVISSDLRQSLIENYATGGFGRQLAQIFNVRYSEFPCLLLIKDVDLIQHYVVSIKELKAEEISRYLRLIFSEIDEALNNGKDAFQALDQYQGNSKLQKAGKKMMTLIEKTIEFPDSIDISADGYPLKDPPADIVRKEIPEIQQYFDDKHKGERKYKVDHAVYISYAWAEEENPNGKEFIEAFEEKCQKEGIATRRDIHDVGYKDSVSEYMETMGQGKAVLVILSKKYLHSKYCMKELIEIATNDNFDDRIFPVILDDVKFRNPEDRLAVRDYWSTKRKELNEKLSKGSLSYTDEIIEELNNYTNIENNVIKLLSRIADMANLTPQQHLDENMDSLFEKLKEQLAK